MRNKISLLQNNLWAKRLIVMIIMTMSAITNSLSDYLKRVFKLDEDIVSLQPLNGSTYKSLPTNKIHLFLINIERETNAGIKFSQQSSSGQHKKGTPQWQLNLYIMIAAAFNEKQYEESLSLMSGVSLFLQSNSFFAIPQTNFNVNIEPINLSLSELSSIWSICGNQYYPSVLCKIRVVTIDADEIKHISKVVSQQDVNI